MPLEKGSLILVDYTARVKDTNDIFDTTREEEAKKTNFYDPTHKYEPKIVSVGESWVLKGLDEALSNANVGDKLNIEVPPEKAFGKRDDSKIRMIPQRKLGDKADEVGVDDENVSALVKRRMGVDESKLQVNLAVPNLEIQLPEDTYLAEGLQIVKRAVANDIFKFVPTVKNIKFIESYQAPAEQKKDEQLKQQQQQPKVEATAEAKQ